MEKEFKYWLSKQISKQTKKPLAESAIKSYVRAIGIISKELIFEQIIPKNKTLYAFDDFIELGHKFL